MKLVKKFSLIVKKLNIAEEKNTAKANINNEDIKYIEFVGIEIPLNIVSIKYAHNIYCIKFFINFFITQ